MGLRWVAEAGGEARRQRGPAQNAPRSGRNPSTPQRPFPPASTVSALSVAAGAARLLYAGAARGPGRRRVAGGASAAVARPPAPTRGRGSRRGTRAPAPLARGGRGEGSAPTARLAGPALSTRVPGGVGRGRAGARRAGA